MELASGIASDVIADVAEVYWNREAKVECSAFEVICEVALVYWKSELFDVR